MSNFNLNQMFDYFIVLTSKELEKSFDSEEVETIFSSFTKRFMELFEKIKDGFNQSQIFHGINPAFIIALDESLPGKKKDKDQVTRFILAIYRMMLEEFVLEPQRRFMASSKDPWSTFVEDTRKRNQKIYDNEYFRFKEVLSTEKEFAFDINRCLYQEFFKKFGREDLGSIMCEYDSLVAKNVSKWVRFELKETIAEGFPRCTFRFFKIKQKFSDDPVIDSIYSFLKIINEADEMLSRKEIMNKGLESEIELEEIVDLIKTIKKHPGIKTAIFNEELVFGNVSSYKRHEEWKTLFNKKNPKELRSKILRNLPLNLREEKVSQLITNIIRHPYEAASIKWICLSYLQHYFSSRVGFESEGVDEIQLNFILEEFAKNYPKMSFEAHPIHQESDNSSRVSIQVYGKGIPEYKSKELAQLIRRKMVTDYPDASLTAIKPIFSVDQVAKIFFDILEDSTQPFQLRELALRVLIGRVGKKLIPYLSTIAKNKDDDPFLRGRAIDSLSSFSRDLPKIFSTLEDFIKLPTPVQRSIVDFVTRYGIKEEMLVHIAKDESLTNAIRKIALRNLGRYPSENVTNFLIKFFNHRSTDELLRQASLEALEKHEDKSKINKEVLKIFINPEESTFIRIEAFETLKSLKYIPTEELERLANPDWIITLGLKQLEK